MNIQLFKTADDERAVSPVIGVILMVAITVILAAVIGAFVLDLGQGQQGNVNAGVSVDKNPSAGTITITVNDMGNANEISFKGDTSSTTTLNGVGDSGEIDVSGSSGSLNIVASDGDNSNVIQTVEYEGFSTP